MQLYTKGECFDHFWVQANKLVTATSESVLSGSFVEKPGEAEYPYYKTKNDAKHVVGCDEKTLFGKNTVATIVSADEKCDKDIELAWTPPPLCTQAQIKSKATLLCRQKEDLYFFTFTVGNSQTRNYYVGQNSFGFFVNPLV